MKSILSIIRNILGWVVIFFDWVTRPEPIQRSPDEQEIIDQEVEKMSLYQFKGCPFCVKVRRKVHELNLPLEYRDARDNQKYRQELKEEGGQIQVPCLRIDRENETEWMYESDDINEFLEKKFIQ